MNMTMKNEMENRENLFRTIEFCYKNLKLNFDRVFVGVIVFGC